MSDALQYAHELFNSVLNDIGSIAAGTLRCPLRATWQKLIWIKNEHSWMVKSFAAPICGEIALLHDRLVFQEKRMK